MREFKERDNYVIKVDGELVKVSREVYETYHRMERWIIRSEIHHLSGVWKSLFRFAFVYAES